MFPNLRMWVMELNDIMVNTCLTWRTALFSPAHLTCVIDSTIRALGYHVLAKFSSSSYESAQHRGELLSLQQVLILPLPSWISVLEAPSFGLFTYVIAKDSPRKKLSDCFRTWISKNLEGQILWVVRTPLLTLSVTQPSFQLAHSPVPPKEIIIVDVRSR